MSLGKFLKAKYSDIQWSDNSLRILTEVYDYGRGESEKETATKVESKKVNKVREDKSSSEKAFSFLE